MKNDEKYEELKKFFLENFETTKNIFDRLHTKNIMNIANRNGFLFADCKMAQAFKSLDIGEYKKTCNIFGEVKTGYYFIIYKPKN